MDKNNFFFTCSCKLIWQSCFHNNLFHLYCQSLLSQCDRKWANENVAMEFQHVPKEYGNLMKVHVEKIQYSKEILFNKTKNRRWVIFISIFTSQTFYDQRIIISKCKAEKVWNEKNEVLIESDSFLN